MVCRRAELVIAILGCSLVACGDDGGAADGGGSTSTGPAATGSSSGAVVDSSGGSSSGGGSSSSGAAPASTGESGFEPPVTVCGDGFVDPGEDCDDGNTDDGDMCPGDCLLVCGLDWELVHEGPTPESDMYGNRIASDAAGNTFVVAEQREVTVDPEGGQTFGPQTTLVLAVDDVGAERWSVVRSSEDGAVRPGDVITDAAGDLYVAITVPATAGGTDVQVVKLAGTDGGEQWVHTLAGPVADGDDRADGLALAPDGTVVVAATVRVADGDDDAWARKIDADDGSELWTASFDGAGGGAFSTDNADLVAVADDGRVILGGNAYVDFMTDPAVVVAFAADGGDPLWTWSPEDDGLSQEHDVQGIVVDDDGNAYLVYERIDNAVDFTVVKLDPDGAVVWTRQMADLVGPEPDEWIVTAAARRSGGGPTLVGSYRLGQGETWFQPWVVQTDVDGTAGCIASFGSVAPSGVMADVRVSGGAVGPGGATTVTGQWGDAGYEAVWVGRFRGD